MGRRFLGTGWPFPPEPDAEGRLDYVSGEEKVRQSVLTILGTARGSRVMRPDFGSRLHELVFARMDAELHARIGEYVTEALVASEPRIDVLGVEVSDRAAADGLVEVDVEYRVRTSNSVFNVVFPFYLNEGRGEGA